MNASRKMTKVISKKLLCVLSAGLLASAIGSEYVLASPGGLPGPLELQQAVTKVEGVVKDKSGEPLIGVSVVLKGTTIGTVTDVDGKYSLNVRGNNPVLEFSYVGYTSQLLPANKAVINVVMEDNQSQLNTVVIVGYGTQKKENLTGAVTSVNVEETLGSRPIADVGRGLQGVVAGLTVQIPSGEVGSDPKMSIRAAVTSIEGSNSPLILLDNVEIPSIQMVNPDDIESISVLKDASSSSIYGAKAAGGVILITTKKGAKEEAISINYSSNLAWQNPSKKIEMAGIDGLEYTLAAQENRKATMPAGGFWRIDRASFEKAKEWQAKYGSTVKATDPVLYGRDWMTFDGINKYGYRIYDPREIMIREWAPTQTHNLSVNGRTGKTSYNIGLGYLDQSGMMKPTKHDDFKRYNASLSLTSEVSKFLTIRGGALYSDRNKRYPSFGSSVSDPWLYVYRWSRLSPIGVTENGLPLRDPAYETMNTGTANLQNKYYGINFGATLNINSDWDIKIDYNYNNEQEESNSSMPQFNAGQAWYTPVLWNDENGNQVFVDENGQVTTDGGMPAYKFAQQEYYSNTTYSYIERNQVKTDKNVLNVYSTYNLKLGNEGLHAFKFMAGMNRVTNKWSSNLLRKTGLFDYENPQFNFAVGNESITAGTNWDAQLGFFGRINYMFSDKYLLEANLRYDGSSKFPTDLQWRWYPSFSAGWIVSNENFMKPVEPIMSFAKIRASWGSIGDQSVSNTLYKAVLTGYKTNWIDGNGSQAYAFGTPKAIDRNITWQDIETLDIGADFRFIKDKLGVTFDWYQRKTNNVIIPGEALPYTYGAESPKGNYGNFRTRGWELTVDFNHRFSNGLSINAMATLSDASTLIAKGTDHSLAWEDRSLSTTYSTGHRFGDIYGYETDRLYQKSDFVYGSDGKIEQVWIILNGDKKLTNKLVGSNPVYQVYHEDGNQVILFGPGDTKYKDLNGDGYITPGLNTNGDPGDKKVIGNSTPRYQYGFRVGADYKGVDLSVFLQGVGKRSVWGNGNLAIAGYNAKEGAIPQAIAEDFWTEERTDAFYPRAWDMGGSNSGYSMLVQSRYLLNMAYLRIKNITVGYTLPPVLTRKVYLTKARFYVSLENFFTFDNLRGLPIDPEAISGSSMFNETNYNLGRTGMGTPTFKTASVGVQLSF